VTMSLRNAAPGGGADTQLHHVTSYISLKDIKMFEEKSN
jgi:hypothetical protein